MQSILTNNMDFCIFCGRPMTEIHHLIFGSERKKADEDGLFVPICSECHTFGHIETGFTIASRVHDNPRAEDLSKMLGQMAYEKNIYKAYYDTINESREDIARAAFLKRYRGYL